MRSYLENPHGGGGGRGGGGQDSEVSESALLRTTAKIHGSPASPPPPRGNNVSPICTGASEVPSHAAPSRNAPAPAGMCEVRAHTHGHLHLSFMNRRQNSWKVPR